MFLKSSSRIKQKTIDVNTNSEETISEDFVFTQPETKNIPEKNQNIELSLSGFIYSDRFLF